MRRAVKPILIILIISFSGVGGYFVAGHGTDDRGYALAKAHFPLIRDRLGVLQNYLVEYKQAHGRYPTNDEGLGALDFDARFKVRCNDRLLRRNFIQMEFQGGDSLQKFREAHGHPPRNADEFNQTELGKSITSRPDVENQATVEVEIAIGKDDKLFVLNRGQVLSPWMTPFGYENRAGFDPAVFQDSPANRDPRGRYSRRIDEGVYIYCFGGESMAQAADAAWWDYNGPRLWGAGLIGLAVLILVVMVAGWGWTNAALMGLVIPGLLGAALAKASYATCYVMCELFSQRDSQMVAQQRELLDKYRAAGVIGEAAYQKAVEGLDLDKVLVPTTRTERPHGK